MIKADIIELDACHSIMSEINQILKKETPNEGTVWVTPYQHEGRGQMGNTWKSNPHENLLMALILYPSFLPINEQFLVSKVVALGIVDALSQEIDELTIKWPNDIYWRDKKLGGILIEGSVCGSKLQNLLIGAGININQTKFDAELPNPVSITQITGTTESPIYLAEEIRSSILYWYSVLFEDKERINKAYFERLYGFGHLLSFVDDEGEFKGCITDVEPSGRLLIVDETNKPRYYWFKEVVHRVSCKF